MGWASSNWSTEGNQQKTKLKYLILKLLGWIVIWEFETFIKGGDLWIKQCQRASWTGEPVPFARDFSSEEITFGIRLPGEKQIPI